MQLGTSTIPLLPAVGVGVAVVLAGLVVWGVLRARSATGTPSRGTRRDRVEESDPGDRDWTGEIAGGAADPPAPPRPLTVAEAVAARRADTGPMPAVPATADARVPAPGVTDRPGDGYRSSYDGPAGPEPGSADDTPAARRASAGLHRAAADEPDADDVGPDRTAAAASTAAGPSGFAGVGAADGAPSVTAPADRAAAAIPCDRPSVAATPGDRAATAAQGVRPAAATTSQDQASGPLTDEDRPPGERGGRTGAADEGSGEDRSPGAPTPEADPGDPAGATPLVPGGEPDELPAGVVPDLAEDIDGLDAVEAVETGPVPPPWSPARTGPGVGPSEPVSVAVQQALAARAVQRARARQDEQDVATDDDPAPVADARDRLLSVLLTDPTAAVGATGELDDTRARIDRLGDVLRRRRAELSSAVQRLHRSGLTGEQIGRLAGLDGDDVRTILEQPFGEGGGGR